MKERSDIMVVDESMMSPRTKLDFLPTVKAGGGSQRPVGRAVVIEGSDIIDRPDYRLTE